MRLAVSASTNVLAHATSSCASGRRVTGSIVADGAKLRSETLASVGRVLEGSMEVGFPENNGSTLSANFLCGEVSNEILLGSYPIHVRASIHLSPP